MQEIKIKAYAGECPCCGTSQTSIHQHEVDILCNGCRHIFSDLNALFNILECDIVKNINMRNDGLIYIKSKFITRQHPNSGRIYEIELPASIKTVRVR